MQSDHPVRLRTRPTPAQNSPSSVEVGQPAGAEPRLAVRAISALRPAARQVRRHDRRKRALLTTSYARHGELTPIIVTADGEIVDGHARVEALKELGRERVLTLVIPDRSPASLKTARLILNRTQEVGVSYDMPSLALEFRDVLAADPTLIAASGFTMAEVDGALFRAVAAKPEPEPPSRSAPVSRLGDVWEVGRHRIVCGNARLGDAYTDLLGSARADMLLSDPPFGTSVRQISSTHEEFVEGSGMSEAEALVFFKEALGMISGHLRDGAIADLFIDARSLVALATALRTTGFEQKAICAWDKQAGSMGSLYRHQIEFIIVSKWGKARHNNIQLGKYKSNRTTLWSSPGLAQFGPGRADALADHPTVKPVGLLADALLDTSNPGDVILDLFVGTGSTLLACERTGRVGRGIELDPRHVDTALRRLEQEIGQAAVHVATGRTFADTARARQAEADQVGSVGEQEVRS